MKQVTFDENDIKKIFTTDTPAKRASRTIGRLLKQAIYIGLIFMFFFYALNYGAFWKRFQYSLAKAPTPPVTETPAPPTEPAPLPDYAPEINIAKISVSAPIVMNIDPNDVVPHLADGVVQMAGSAEPGQIGNVVIIGHSSDFPWSTGHYKNIFALLDKLAVGDEITIPYKIDRYVYRVTSSRVVKPTEVSVLAKTSSPTLTLITCYPVGTARSRLIITAELVSGQTTTTQQTDPLAANLPKPR